MPPALKTCFGFFRQHTKRIVLSSLFLCCTLLTTQANTFPYPREPDFHAGNDNISAIEFLTPDVVQFTSPSGISVWKISAAEEIVPEARPSQAPAIDYHHPSNSRLLLDSGKLYLKSGDSQESISIGDPEKTYSSARFSQDGQGVLAIGRSDSQPEITLERFSVADGSLRWSDAANANTHYHFLSPTARIAKLERTASSAYHDQLSLIDESTGQTIASSNVSAAQLSSFSESFIDPQGRLIVASGNGSTSYFLNAISGTIASANYGSLGFYPRYHQPEMSLDAGRVILQFDGGVEPIRIIDTTTGETIADIKDIPLNTAQFFQTTYNLSPNGDALCILTSPGRIDKWDLATNASVQTFTHSNVPFTHILPTADETTLLAARSTGRENDYIVAFDTANASVRYTLLRRSAPSLRSSGYVSSSPESLDISPDGNYFYFHSSNSTLFFDLQDGSELETLPATNGKLLASSFVSNRSSYFLFFKNGVIEERSADDFSLLNGGLYPDFRFADDMLVDKTTGRVLVKIGGGLFALDIFTGQLLWSNPQFGFDAAYYNFSANGTRFVLVNPSGTSGVFDIEENGFVLDFSTFENGGAWEHALSHDGSRYARITTPPGDTYQKTVEVYSNQTGQLLYSSPFYPDIDSLHFSGAPDELLFIVQKETLDEEALSILQIDTNSSTLSETPFHFPETQTIASTSLSADHNRLLILTLDDTLYTVDLTTQSTSSPLSLRSDPIDYYRNASITTNADGSTYFFVDRRKLADGGHIQTARILPSSIEKIPTGFLVNTPPSPQTQAYQMQVSPDLLQWNNQDSLLPASSSAPLEWNLAPPENGAIFGRVLGIETTNTD